MKAKQILEKVHYSFQSKYDSSKDVNIHKNPNNPEMEALLQKTEFNEVRGLLDR